MNKQKYDCEAVIDTTPLVDGKTTNAPPVSLVFNVAVPTSVPERTVKVTVMLLSMSWQLNAWPAEKLRANAPSEITVSALAKEMNGRKADRKITLIRIKVAFFLMLIDFLYNTGEI